MVGYAYSFDYECGYSNIFIKAYSCDDLSFITPSTPCITYRMNRSSEKVQIVSDNTMGQILHLSLRHAKEILDLISLEEFNRCYPVFMSWYVTASGLLLKQNSSDFYSVWPVPPRMISSDAAYINITHLCFKETPSELELSFTQNILCSALFLCGIFVSDPLLVSGNCLYCSSEIAGAELKLFGTSKLYSFIPSSCRIKRKKLKIKRKILIKKIEKTNFDNSDYRNDVSEWIANIKRECISDVLEVIKRCLEENKSITWLIRRVKYAISKSLDVLTELGTELISRSTAGASSDIKKLSFDELLCAFTFADSMRDITKNIRLSKQRRSAVNKLVAPMCIYKGRFYYKESKNYED